MFRVTNVTLRGFQGFQGSHVILPSQVLLWDLFAVLQPPRGPGTKWTCGAFVGQVPVGNGPFSYQNISKPNGLYLGQPTKPIWESFWPVNVRHVKYMSKIICVAMAPHAQDGYMHIVNMGFSGWCGKDDDVSWMLSPGWTFERKQSYQLSILSHNTQATENEFECFTGTEALHYSSPLHLVGKCSIATFDQKKGIPGYPCYRMLMTMSTELYTIQKIYSHALKVKKQL